MTATRLFTFAKYIALVLAIAGLILAQFVGLHALGFVLVLLGVAAGGGAISAGVLAQQQKDPAR